MDQNGTYRDAGVHTEGVKDIRGKGNEESDDAGSRAES